MQAFWSACFGISARKALRDYLLFAAVLVFILLAIAWTIDLARNLDAVRETARERQVPLFQILGPYLSYRAADIIVRLFPVAVFFGIFLAEIYRRHRLDTVILSAAGASPWRLTGPFLIFGVIAGTFHYQLENRLRPNAVAAQVELGVGGYANRFRTDRWFRGSYWFILGDISVQGDVFRSETPALENVMIFKGVQSNTLQTVYQAARMDPLDDKGNWRLQDVVVWADGEEVGERVSEKVLALDMVPEQLIHFNVPGFYLQTDALRALARAYPGSRPQVWADVALWRRNTIWLVPFVIAVFAASLARLGYVGRLMHIPRLIALGAVGYMSVVSLKVFFAVGEIGGLSGQVANLAPISMLGGLGLLLTLRAMWR